MSNSTTADLDALTGLESAKKVVVGIASGSLGQDEGDGRLASGVQAVLFYGMAGSGKRRLAQILAKAWLCSARGKGERIGTGQTGDPSAERTDPPLAGGGACGTCQACLAFERGRSTDVLWLEPAGASRILRLGAISPTKPDDDDYPVSAQLFLRTPPLAARHKIVVIEDADRLNAPAANSLLKTLEEPPPYGKFILLTDSVGSIIPTVLSRCLAVACEVPSHGSGALTGDGPSEDWAASLAGGAPGRARDLQEFAEAYKPIFDFALGLSGRAKVEALVAAEEFDRLADVLQQARKLGARAANAEALLVLARAYSLSPGQRAEFLQAIIEAHRRILGNANASSVFDALFTSALA